jgi:DNA-binding response OmpR family regulator
MGYILAVEDDPYIQVLIRRKLENAGYEVRVYGDGDTIDALIAEKRPDLILLDVMIPGKTGLEICKAIKTSMGISAPPIIIVSARGQQQDVETAYRVGADGYLIKPFSPKDLLEMVQKYTNFER